MEQVLEVLAQISVQQVNTVQPEVQHVQTAQQHNIVQKELEVVQPVEQENGVQPEVQHVVR